MSKIKLGFLFNVRHIYPDADDPRSHLQADFDDPKTIKQMIRHFKNIGYKVYPIEADEKAYLKLYKLRNKIDIVYNYAEGIYGASREAQLPAMMEMLQIPYTGSNPLTQAILLDKAKTKEILTANNIDVLPHIIVEGAASIPKHDMEYPLIVKPIAEGSSAGITNESVVDNEKELKIRAEFVINTFKDKALVEPFLTGREFSVPMLGNPPEILPIIESDHSKLPENYKPLDSLEVKWLFEEQSSDNNLICPADMHHELKSKISRMCLEAWKALEIKDYCRVDIRCNQRGKPFILEINSPVGMIPPEVSKTSYFSFSARTIGLEYEALLKRIITTALNRYKI